MTEKQKNPNKQPNYKRRRAVVGTLAAGALVGGGYAVAEGVDFIAEKTERITVAETTFDIGQGDGVISAAEDRVEQIFEEQNIDPANIPYGQITYQGQEAGAEYRDLTGETTLQPGATFNLNITTSEMGGYSVEISPTVESGTKS